MGISIQCILEREVAGIPIMEGKSLALAYCGDGGGEGDDDPGPATNVLTVDFGGAKPPRVGAGAAGGDDPPTEPVFGALDEFIRGDGDHWHEPAKGLVAVRAILERLRGGGVTLTMPQEFGMFDAGEAEDLTEDVIFDLEELEEILVAAERAETRFQLTFDV